MRPSQICGSKTQPSGLDEFWKSQPMPLLPIYGGRRVFSTRIYGARASLTCCGIPHGAPPYVEAGTDSFSGGWPSSSSGMLSPSCPATSVSIR